MSAPEQEQLYAIIHGYVQGVSFRYYTVHEATALGLTGWVRNLQDGTVEVLAEGPRPDLERLLEFLHRGSPSAVVRKVDTQWKKATRRYFSFEVRYVTAD